MARAPAGLQRALYIPCMSLHWCRRSALIPVLTQPTPPSCSHLCTKALCSLPGLPIPRHWGPYLPGAHSSQLVPMKAWLQLHRPEPLILSSQVPRFPHGASSPHGQAADKDIHEAVVMWGPTLGQRHSHRGDTHMYGMLSGLGQPTTLGWGLRKMVGVCPGWLLLPTHTEPARSCCVGSTEPVAICGRVLAAEGQAMRLTTALSCPRLTGAFSKGREFPVQTSPQIPIPDGALCLGRPAPQPPGIHARCLTLAVAAIVVLAALGDPLCGNAVPPAASFQRPPGREVSSERFPRGGRPGWPQWVVMAKQKSVPEQLVFEIVAAPGSPL